MSDLNSSADSSTTEIPAAEIPLSAPTGSSYFCLKAAGLEREREEEFASYCFEHGAQGVSEDLKFVQPDLVYEPDVVETAIFDANVYFSEKPDENFLLRLQSEFPQVQLEMQSEENRDWMHEWKKGFKPFLFAAPFWIVPSWFEPPAEVRDDLSRALFVDPGMAFGTGTHETTRLAATLLIQEIGRWTSSPAPDFLNSPHAARRSPPQSLIDVGTGTAILALVASRLGVETVVGLDNDPEARRTARENLAHNGASQIQIPDTSIQEEQGRYDIVMANIIDGVLTILARDLVRVLKPGGRMILSGVLVEREAAFYENFTQITGLRFIEKITESEWSAAVLERV